MSQKRPSLQDSLNSSSKVNSVTSRDVKSREKREQVLIGAMFDSAVRKQLKILEAETDSNLKELLGEAINDLFAKYHKSQIA